MKMKVKRQVEVEEEIEVELPLTHPETGEVLVVDLSRSSDQGNAFAFLGAADHAMRRAHIPREVRDAYMQEAQSGDYDHLVQTTMRWFEVNV